MIPLTLLWDYSWESSIGIDLPWSPPHATLFAAMVLAGALALASSRAIGARITLWGTAAFLTSWLFDGWWQSAYGLAAGLWGPPQLFKTAAFFAVLVGTWLQTASPLTAGALLALISVVTLPHLYANRQHSAAFYEIAAGAYPIVLAAQSVMGGATQGATASRRCSLLAAFPATTAALCYLALWGAVVWLLPLFPAQTLVAPIINPLDHMLPPPFPLLLIGPALAFDVSWRVFPARRVGRGAAVEGGIAFLLTFLLVQWSFAAFLLSPLAESRFFAGGGRHWPFFLHVAAEARTQFWLTPADPFDWKSGLIAAALAIVATGLGLAIGTWRKASCT